MHRVKTAAVHALEQNEMTTRIRDGDRCRNVLTLGDLHRRFHHLTRARECQAFCRCNVHVCFRFPHFVTSPQPSPTARSPEYWARAGLYQLTSSNAPSQLLYNGSVRSSMRRCAFHSVLRALYGSPLNWRAT